jgi:hypothetical protein
MMQMLTGRPAHLGLGHAASLGTNRDLHHPLSLQQR